MVAYVIHVPVWSGLIGDFQSGFCYLFETCLTLNLEEYLCTVWRQTSSTVWIDQIVFWLVEIHILSMHDSKDVCSSLIILLFSKILWFLLTFSSKKVETNWTLDIFNASNYFFNFRMLFFFRCSRHFSF